MLGFIITIMVGKTFPMLLGVVLCIESSEETEVDKRIRKVTVHVRKGKTLRHLFWQLRTGFFVGPRRWWMGVLRDWHRRLLHSVILHGTVGWRHSSPL